MKSEKTSAWKQEKALSGEWLPLALLGYLLLHLYPQSFSQQTDECPSGLYTSWLVVMATASHKTRFLPEFLLTHSFLPGKTLWV